MVDFFFVLSGFVIALNYQARIHTASDLFNFQMRRFLRLYPLHILMLFVFLGIEVAKYLAESGLGLRANSPAFSSNDAFSFVSNLFLVQNFAVAELTWNGVSWSISAEFFAYLVFACLVLLTARRRGLFLIASAVVAIGALVIFQRNELGPSNVLGPARCGYAFFLGVLTFNLYDRISGKISFGNSVVSFALIVLSLLTMALIGGARYAESSLAPLVFALLILSLVLTPATARVNRALGHRALVYLGTISYGIYMIHTAVIWVFNRFFTLVLKVPTDRSSGRGHLELEGWAADAFVALIVLVVLALAHASYRFVESRFYRYRQRFPI